jgi:hypothetical protein
MWAQTVKFPITSSLFGPQTPSKCRVITNDVSNYINLLVTIAHIICNHPICSSLHFYFLNRAPHHGGVLGEWRYEGVSKSFRTARLERELQMVGLSATRSSCIAILWVILVSFVAITLRVASQRVFIVVIVVYFVINSVRKLLYTILYSSTHSWPLH